MSTYDYTKLQAKAVELLTKFGSDVQIKNGASSVLSTVKAVSGDVASNFKATSLDTNVDVVFYLPYDTVGVETGNYLTVGNNTYRIINTTTYSPGSDILLYAVFGSK